MVDNIPVSMKLAVSAIALYCTWPYAIGLRASQTMIGRFRVIMFDVTHFGLTWVAPLWGSLPHVCSTACNGSRIVRHIKLDRLTFQCNIRM